MMIRISGSRSTLKFVSQESVYGPSYEDIPRRVPDVRLMKEILKADAKVPLEEGLRQTLEWYRNGHRK